MTTFALVTAGTVQSESGAVPSSARRLDTQEWVLGLPDASVALQQACGYIAVTDVARPADTATLTYTRSLTVAGQTVTVTWVSRNKTAGEIQAATDAANVAANTPTLDTQVRAAYNANRTYLAIGAPTNAQVVAQVRLLTRIANGLIRASRPDLLADPIID